MHSTYSYLHDVIILSINLIIFYHQQNLIFYILLIVFRLENGLRETKKGGSIVVTVKNMQAAMPLKIISPSYPLSPQLKIISPSDPPSLSAALTTKNVMVKKQIFELLSALCYNSQRGYDMALEALQIAKVRKLVSWLVNY